jgi:alanine racemase
VTEAYEGERLVSDVQLIDRRPTWAEINLDALARNFHTIRNLIGHETRIIAVVKADAYGHGAVQCARRLEHEGASTFAVALAEEGIALRRAGLSGVIIVLGGFWQNQSELCLRDNLVPVIFRVDMAEAMNRVARVAGKIADVHIKIDTGMGRLGVRWDAAGEFLDALVRLKNIRIDGVLTHFAAADEPERDCFTEEQSARFGRVIGMMRERGMNPTYVDAANSAATFRSEKITEAQANAVRPGGTLYGLWRDVLAPATLSPPPALYPVMSLRSRIILLKRVSKGETLGYGCTFEASRDTLVATLPLGYNDGYVRALSNRGRVIVREQFASVIGRVSMDLTLIDVTDIPQISLGDTVTLFGTDNALSIPVEDVAKTAGTISYEITCGISARVPRIFVPAI